jgi:VanZ family protein
VIVWSVTVAWAALIFSLSTETFGSFFTARLLSRILEFLRVTLSSTAFAELHFAIRKLAHLAEYALYSLLLYHSLRDDRQPFWRTRTAVWAVVIAGAYSLTDEIHQAFVPNRGASLEDCGIDTLGAVLGIAILYAWNVITSGGKSQATLNQESRLEAPFPRPGASTPTASASSR